MRIGARWIWDGKSSPSPGVVSVNGDRVAAVDADDPSSADVTYDGLLLPGLVNAHVHLDLTLAPSTESLEGLFPDWLLGVRDRRIELGRAGLEAAAAEGVRRSLAHGTTLVVDYDSRGYSPPAVDGTALRRVLLREIIGFESDFESRVAALRAFLDGSPDPRREARGLAPHAPYTVHPQLLEAAVGLARERGVPWSMHVAELAAEREFLVDGTGDFAEFSRRVGLDPDSFPRAGTGPVETLHRSGLLDTPTLLVHLNDLTDDDIARLAGRPVTAVFCPRSHAWFGRGEHPLPRLREAGVPVALGTDGMISNGALDMLAEARHTLALFPEIPPAEILAMITTTPRRALAACGVPEDVRGPEAIEPGAPADFAVFAVAGKKPDEVLGELLRTHAPCLATWIAGEITHPAP